MFAKRPGGNNSSNNETSNIDTSNNEINNRNNKTKLRNELINLYGGRNGYLNNKQINTFVNKYTGNSMNVKKQAYKKAYTQYMNYMAGEFTQDIIRSIKAKMKSSPTCPSGVVGGGPSFVGTAKAVIGGVKAAASKQNQNVRQNGRNRRITAGQPPARFANGNRTGAPQARSRGRP